MFTSRLVRAVTNLALALINATLILLLLCLWFAWKLTSEVNALTGDVAANLLTVQPLRDDVAGLTRQIAGLRDDLAAAGGQADAASSEALVRLRARADEVEERLATLSDLGDRIVADPGLMLDRVVTVAAARLGDEAQKLMNCQRPVPDAP